MTLTPEQQQELIAWFKQPLLQPLIVNSPNGFTVDIMKYNPRLIYEGTPEVQVVVTTSTTRVTFRLASVKAYRISTHSITVELE